MSTQLTWFRRSAGRWLLKEANGRIWAVVAPWHPYRGRYRATCMHSEANTYSRKRYGGNYWVAGSGVPATKRNIEEWLARHCWDSFEITREAAS